MSVVKIKDRQFPRKTKGQKNWHSLDDVAKLDHYVAIPEQQMMLDMGFLGQDAMRCLDVEEHCSETGEPYFTQDEYHEHGFNPEDRKRVQCPLYQQRCSALSAIMQEGQPPCEVLYEKLSYMLKCQE